jgi:hypothetical protein
LKKTPTGDLTLGQRFVEALSAENIDRQCKHEIRQGRPYLTEAEVQIMFDANKKQGYPPSSLAQAKKILGIPEPQLPIQFVDWDHRPAVLIDGKAYAVLGPRDPWCMVDSADVAHTAGVMTEAAWRKEFQGGFGALDLSLIARARRQHIQYLNWHERPAVAVCGKAFAISSSPPWMWKSVDESDVTLRGIYMPERAWRRMFMGKFGRLALFRQENRPTDKEFDDAALAVVKAHRDHISRDPFTPARILHAAIMAAEPLPTPTGGSQPHTYPGVAALVMSHTLRDVADGDDEMLLWASDMEWGARSLIRLHLGWADDGVAN